MNPRKRFVGKRRQQARIEKSSGKEIRFSGRAACLAILQERPESVRRLYCAESMVPLLGKTLKSLAQAGKVYRIVSVEELDRIAASTHHQGIVVVTEPRQEWTWADFLRTIRENNPPLLLCLAGVENPHNFGAILRSAAHFGIPFVIGGETLPRLSPAAARTAEGGGEFVELVRSGNLSRGLQELKSLGYAVYLVEQGPNAVALHNLTFQKKSVLVLGNEVNGIPRDLTIVADSSVEISGSGQVDSLNVSVATAIVLAAHDLQTRRSVPKHVD